MVKAWQDQLKRWRKEHSDNYAKALLNPPAPTTVMKFIPYPGVILLMGERGMGKSVEAHWIGSILHRAHNIPVVMHLPTIPDKLRKRINSMLPPWIRVVTRREDWPHGGVVIYDEAAQSAHARRTQSKDAVVLDNLISISRQRQQTIIFISHHSRKLDPNVVHEVDQIHWKQPTYAHQLFERDEIADFSMKAFDFFLALREGVSWRDCTERVKRKVKNTTLALDMQDFKFATFTNGLPDYWNEELSCIFQSIANLTNPEEEPRGVPGLR